jgi:hypothetical protein
LTIKTYQDFENATDVGSFIKSAVEELRSTARYAIAADANEYYAGRNPTTAKYQKFLRQVDGSLTPDLYSANYKTKSGFFRLEVMQIVQYVLGNGMTFTEDATKIALGQDVDIKIADAGKIALTDGVAFLFFNLDRVEVFGLADTPNRPGFCPLFDAYTNDLRAGVRYWYTMDGTKTKTLTAVLYTPEGYTEYVERSGNMEMTEAGQRPYIVTTTSTAAHGVETVTGKGYGTLPIVPLWGNDLHQSELVFVRETIDCYDFIKNGLANEIDDNPGLYWMLKNSGGMDDMDIAQFFDRLRTLKAAVVDSDDLSAERAEVPVEARRTMLEILERDFYRDAMLFNARDLSGGNKTATEITAAYQAQNIKCADFENNVSLAVSALLEKCLGIKDVPKFKWDQIANETERTNQVMTASSVLGTRLTLEKLPFLTPEEVQQRLDEIADEDMYRLTGYRAPENGGGEDGDLDN